MKKLTAALLTFASLNASIALSGTPEQDPVVANLRDRFEKGSEPTQEYLLQNSFKCKDILARLDDFRQIDHTNELRRFEEFDGFVIQIWKEAFFHKALYAFNGKEIISSAKHPAGPQMYDAFRVDAKGYLIGEVSYVINAPELVLKPVSASKGRVSHYSICVPK